MSIDARAPTKSAHILFCLSIGRGHATPVMTLAKQLAWLGNSITVVFSSPESYASMTSSDLEVTEGLDIALLLLPGAPPQQSSGRVVMGGVRNFSMKTSPIPLDYSAQESAFEELLRSMESPPVAVIADMMVFWSFAPASKFHLRNYLFYPSSLFYMVAMFRAGNFSEKDGGLAVPGLPFVPWNQIPDSLKYWNNPLEHGLKKHLTEVDGILVNTFYELDDKVFEALSQMPETKSVSQKLIPVGPLIHPALLEDMGQDQNDKVRLVQLYKSVEESTCMEWLDKQAPSSVLFISFGSWAALGEKQVHELALGLKASQHTFLWVVPQCSPHAFPQGFLDSIHDSGLIVWGWAPQSLILRHPSIGGFVTHCGSNSVLECITLCAAPIVCWPFMGDQPFTCRYVVDELKIGIEVKASAEGFVEWQEVEKCVKMVMMESTERKAMMQRALQLKNKSRKHGLNFKENLNAFLREISCDVGQ